MGIIALVAVVLFGVVTATEILNFEGLTLIVRAILRIGARIISGLIVFAVGALFGQSGVPVWSTLWAPARPEFWPRLPASPSSFL